MKNSEPSRNKCKIDKFIFSFYLKTLNSTFNLTPVSLLLQQQHSDIACGRRRHHIASKKEEKTQKYSQFFFFLISSILTEIIFITLHIIYSLVNSIHTYTNKDSLRIHTKGFIHLPLSFSKLASTSLLYWSKFYECICEFYTQLC